MFMAYNNGLTITCNDLDYNLIGDKSYAKVLSKLDKSFNKLLKKIDYTPPTRIRGKGQSIKELYNR